jgi:hypothetical protein
MFQPVLLHSTSLLASVSASKAVNQCAWSLKISRPVSDGQGPRLQLFAYCVVDTAVP